MAVASNLGPRRIRVAIVDDADEIRDLLRISFATDDRFEVVGEGSDGEEAIILAERLGPDVLVLDRQMPHLGGVEALPEIHRRAPRTEVVLYTAGADAGTCQQALAAGAISVIDKLDATSGSVVDEIARILLDHWAEPDATVEVRVGPVPARAARAWVANTAGILAAIRRHPGIVGEPVPEDVLEVFDRFLTAWGEVAARTDEFRWVARATANDVERLVEYWALLDRLTDEQLESIGCSWSPPEAQPFFRALTAGVLEALAAHAQTRALARRLAPQWTPGTARRDDP